MIDILVYLFENYYDFAAHPEPETLARKLGAVGFEEKVISEALDWLAEIRCSRTVRFAGDGRSLRIYRALEQDKLGAECLGLLCFLESAGIVSPVLRELIVDRAMMLEDARVPLTKFKIIVLMVMWGMDQELEPLIVEELLYDAGTDPLH